MDLTVNASVHSTTAKRSSRTIMEATSEEEAVSVVASITPLTTTRLVPADDLESPRSVTALVSPPPKRQKQVLVVTGQRLGFGGSILDYVQGFDLAGHVFAFCGPRDTARCAQVCKGWKHASERHLSLWRTFVEEDFGLPKGNPMDHDWHRVYPAITTALQKAPRQHLEARVEFADDGGNFPGYPASHALMDSKNMVWCTSTGADRNVDLVVQLPTLCLLTGFRAANGGRGYSAPLKEGLVFVGVDPPDLEAARCYNVKEQQGEGGLGSEWVRHLFRPKQKTAVSFGDNNNEAAPIVEEGNVEPPPPQAVPAPAIENDDANEQTNDQTNDDDEDAPRQRSAEAPPPAPEGAPTPVAAFRFPNLVEAYLGQSEQTLAKPRLARFVHFKLLTSHSPPGLEHISDNIDLMNFHPLGIPMGHLQRHVPFEAPVVPEYTRQHEVRPSRMAANPLDNGLVPPHEGWFVNEDFF